MGVEDPDWRSTQSSDHTAYGGLRAGVLGSASNLRFGGSVAYARATGADIGLGPTFTGGEAAARALRSKNAQATRDREAARLARASQERYSRGNAAAMALRELEDPVKGTKKKSESRRGRARKKFESRDLVRGHNGAFESTLTKTTGSRITHRNIRTEGTRSFSLRLRGSNPFGGAIVGAGNQLAQIYGDLWYQQRAIRQRRANILAVGRRGAAATRAFQPTALPGRTGAAATRAPASVAAAAGLPVARPQTAQPGRPATVAAPVAQRATTSASAPTRTPTRSTPTRSNISVNWDPWSMLQAALAPPVRRVSAFVGRARVAARSAFAPLSRPPQSSGTSSAALTPANLSAVGFAATAGSGSDCKCPPKPRRAPTCRNPVVSKRRRGDLITITRRITCPQSK